MQERATGRIRTGLVEIRLTSTAGLPSQEAREVLDVSPSGAGLKVAIPLATDQELTVELAHPILETAVQLQARAAWCRMTPGDPLPHAGIEFVSTNERQRLALRLIQAAEVSCRVVDDGRTVGFIMTPTEGAWALYDASTLKVATLRRSGAGFEVTFLGLPEEGAQPFEVASLPEAVALAIGLEGAPLIVPPEGGSWAPVSLDAPPRAAPRRPAPAPAAPAATVAGGASAPAPVAGAQAAYHSVLAGGYHVGFVAVTSVDDAWSLYDDGWREVAVITPSRGRYKVIPVGADPNDSLVHAMARTFLGAVRIGFGLHVDPEVDPPVGPEASETSTADLTASRSGDEDEPIGSEEPAADSDADIGLGESSIAAEPEPPRAEGGPGSASHKRQHHKVIGSEGLVGYVAPTLGVEGVWSAYSLEREKVAMIAPDGSRYRVVFMGTEADESLEYMVARNLKGAVAISFELDEIPKIEPPLPSR